MTKRQTRFGESVWLDTVKTVGVAAVTLLVMFLIGGFLALMVVAPWGRASPDCSMFCVLERRLGLSQSQPSSRNDSHLLDKAVHEFRFRGAKW